MPEKWRERERKKKGLLSRAKQQLVRSFANTPSNAIVIFPSTLGEEKNRKRAGVRARGANERAGESPSGKLPLAFIRPNGYARPIHGTIFFLASLSFSAFFFFFILSERLQFSVITRLVDDSITSWRCGARSVVDVTRHILRL